MTTSRNGLFSDALDYAYHAIGGHFPYSTYVSGYPIIGKLWDLFSEDGRGFDRIVTAAAKVAEDNNGVAWWRFGPTIDLALMANPGDIREVIKENHDNIIFHDSTGSFKLFFGPDSIFNAPYKSDRWNDLRPRFISFLVKDSTLTKDAVPMQGMIDRHIKRIEMQEGNQLSNLEQFCNSLTMDMIGLKLGINHMGEEDKAKLSGLLAKAAVEVANPYNQVIAPWVPGYDFEKSKLYGLMSEGWNTLRKIIRENEDNMRSTNNWLNQDGNHDRDYFTQDVLYNVTQFLVAGHETTAKLLLFTLIMLSDPKHKHVLDKLREEIDKQGVPPEEFTRENVKKMDYMEAVMNEVLRLYPPIPDMVFKVAKGFSIADGQYTFKAGDMAVISPRTTGHSKKIWGEDAEDFRPERMFEFDKDVDSRMKPYTHFPFGFMPRQCVGRLFSKQEVALTVARLVNNYDLTMQLKDGTPLQHPVPFHQVFTLRVGVDNIAVKFNERAKPAQKLRLAS